jgi:hypothetical protein
MHVSSLMKRKGLDKPSSTVLKSRREAVLNCVREAITDGITVSSLANRLKHLTSFPLDDAEREATIQRDLYWLESEELIVRCPFKQHNGKYRGKILWRVKS